MKIIAWLKKYFLWIVGGIGLLLAAILSVGYGKDKVNKSKTDALLDKKAKAIKDLKAARQTELSKEDNLRLEEEKIDSKVVAIDEKIKKIQRKKNSISKPKEEKISSQELKDKFNARYKNKTV